MIRLMFVPKQQIFHFENLNVLHCRPSSLVLSQLGCTHTNDFVSGDGGIGSEVEIESGKIRPNNANYTIFGIKTSSILSSPYSAQGQSVVGVDTLSGESTSLPASLESASPSSVRTSASRVVTFPIQMEEHAEMGQLVFDEVAIFRWEWIDEEFDASFALASLISYCEYFQKYYFIYDIDALVLAARSTAHRNGVIPWDTPMPPDTGESSTLSTFIAVSPP